MGKPLINDASRRHFTEYLNVLEVTEIPEHCQSTRILRQDGGNMIFGSMMLLTAERSTYPPSAPTRRHVSVMGRRETVLFSGISRCEERSDTLLS